MLPDTFTADFELVPADAPVGEFSEIRQAIASVYFEHPRALDIRCLWTRGPVCYFRVNWWTDVTSIAPRVRRSAFVVVEAREHGYRVVDATGRQAA